METPVIEKLPIFVYGSLRPGASSFTLVRNWIEEYGTRPARLFGFQMYRCGGFPGIIQDQDNEDIPVVGELLLIRPENWAECIARLDRYENNGFLFDRTDKFYANIWGTHKPVPTHWDSPGTNSIRVWVYVVNPTNLEVDPHKVIKSNDWMNRG